MLSLSRCTCFHLRRAARRVSQLYDHALAPVGLSLNEYSILRRLEVAQSLGTLASTLGMDRTTLTRNLKPLLAAGWITTQRGEDARQKWVRLSRSGRGLLVRARPHWHAAQVQLETLFGAAPTAQLHATLARLDAVLEAHADYKDDDDKDYKDDDDKDYKDDDDK